MPTDTHRPDFDGGIEIPPPLGIPGTETALRRSKAIPAEWVEAYLQRVERLQGVRVARGIGKQLTLFLDYAERSTAGGVRLPWWEYSRALEWINEHTNGFRLTLARARHLLDTLHDFYDALVADGRLEDYRDIDQARAVLCAGRTLRLLPRPPRTGAEPWTALRPPDGELVSFSLADYWLCLLWGHLGRSWAALEERVALVPGGTARVVAVHDLRARLDDARCASPLRLLPSATAASDLEDALRWLSRPNGGPETEPAAPPADPAVAALTTPQLLSRLATAFPRLPRLEMEECLRRGSEVIPGCIGVLRGEGVAAGLTDPVWTIVVLGELRDPRAIDVLVQYLATDDEGGSAVAAVEALGKIGPAALPALDAVIATGTTTARLYAYGALGMIRTDDAYQRLVAALGRDTELCDVIARALAEHGRRDAIEVLHQASARTHAPRWVQIQFESAIVALLHGPTPGAR